MISHCKAKNEQDAVTQYNEILNTLLQNRLVQETMKFKQQRLERIEDTLSTEELIEQLLCVNAPLLPDTIQKMKNLFEEKASVVLFRNKPYILFHGKQTLGWEGSDRYEILFCLYQLPVWIDGILIFKCIERNCKFELRIFLEDHEQSSIGYFSQRTIHRCFTKCSQNEVMHIIEEEKNQFFCKNRSQRYYSTLIMDSLNFTNPCIYGLRSLQFVQQSEIDKTLRRAISVEQQ